MSLTRRARAVADAGASRSLVDVYAAVVGLAMAGAGLTSANPVLAALGALVLGTGLGRTLAGVDRVYLEGFADGIVAEAAGAAAAGEPSERRADVRRLRGGPGDDDRAGAPGPERPASGGPRGGTDRGDERSAPELVEGGPRRPRPSLDPDGAPVAVADGPRHSSFPIPAAHRTGPPIQIGPTSARRRRPARKLG